MIANFYLRPESSGFDIAGVRAWLDRRPDAVEDPRQANRYFLFGDSTIADSAYVEMVREPARQPRSCKVLLSPEEIYIENEFGHWEDARSSVDLFEWLWSQNRCRIVHQFGDDITDSFLDKGPSFLFGVAVEHPLAWKQTLVPLGRFRELDRNDSRSGPSLEIAKRPHPATDENNVVGYLKSGVLLEHTDEEAIDACDGEHSLGPLDYLTDGLYVWPSDLVYYVRHYHARLPRAFMIRARNNGWVVPAGIDVASLPPLPP